MNSQIHFSKAPNSSICKSIAELHRMSLEVDFLPSLGIQFLHSFYQTLSRSQLGRFYWIGVDDQTIGVLVGIDERSKLSSTLIKHGFLPICFHVFLAILRKPS